MKTLLQHRFYLIIGVVCLLIGVGLNVNAAGTIRWTGATNSNWTTTTNWTTVSGTASNPPGPGDIVEIGTGEITNQPTITDNTTIAGLTFGTSAAGALTITGDAVSLTVNGTVTLICGATAGSTIIGTGTLTLGGDVTVTDATTGTNGATIYCNVALGSADRTFTVANDGTTATDLTVSGVISSTNNGFIKAGGGKMMVSGTNTFTGATTINAGVLNVQNAQGTGTTAGGVTVASDAALELQAGISVGAEALSLTGSGISTTGALRSLSGDNTWGGAVSPGSSVYFGIDANSLTLTGGISLIPYQVLKVGAGTLIMNSADQATGKHTISQGTVKLGPSGSIPVDYWIINDGATLDLNGNNLSLGAFGNQRIDLTGGSITTGAGTATIANNATTVYVYANANPSSISGNLNLNTFTPNFNVASGAVLNISAVISNGSLYKTGDGDMTLSGTNTYAGTTTISAGRMIAASAAPSGSSGAFGNATSAIILGDEATTTNNSSPTLITGGAFSIARPVTIANQATTGLYSIGGNTNNNSTFSGAVTINQPLKVTQIATTGTNTLSITGGITTSNLGTKNLTFDNAGAVIVGTTAITKGTGDMAVIKQNNGALTLSTTNTYTGGSTLSAGILNINNNQALGTLAGTFTISGGTIDATTSGISTAAYTLALNADFTFTGTNNLNLGSGTVTMNADRQITVSNNTITIGGAIYQINSSLTKAGSGTLSFGSNAVTLNSLTINAGTLIPTSGMTTLNGNFSNNSGISSFNSNTGTVTFNGSGAQSIGGSASTTFYNLTNTNTDATGLSVGITTTVSNNLTFSSASNGKISTGSYALYLTKATPLTAIIGANSTRYVNGNLQFAFPNGATSSLVYPVGTSSTYAPATLSMNGVSTPIIITGYTATGEPPDENNPATNGSGIDQTKKVSNYWTFTKSGAGTFTTYDIKFDYSDGSVTKTGTPANYVLRKFTSSWVTTNDTVTGNTITATGLDSFSEFEAGETADALTVSLQPSNSTVCSGDNTSFTSASTSTPAPSMQWQRSTNGSSWTSVTSTLDAGTIYSTFTTATVNLTGPTTGLNGYQYRAAFTNINGTVNSNPSTLTIRTSGTWLGKTSSSWNESSNWCGDVPTSSTNVSISPGTTYAPHIDIANAVSNNLNINSGAILTIDAAMALTISGTLTNSATVTGLVLASDPTGTASLIHNTNSIPATVERYITGHDSAWHFLSTPVAAQEISENPGNSTSWLPSGTYGGTGGTGYDMYLWDEPKSCWKYKLNAKWDSLNSGVNNFNVGRGYLYSVQATNPTKSFTGNLNNGSVNYTLKYAATDAALKGFNLVGNPYPSSIDWSAGTGWSRENLAGTGSGKDMWIFNPDSQNYGVYNSGDGAGEGTNGVTKNIPPMQGFFVRAASGGTLSMTNAVRTHSGANAWKTTRINPDAISAIVLSERNQTWDEVRILFGYPGGQAGAAKLFSPLATAPSLYLSAGKENYTVRYLTDTVAYPYVPVQFKPGTNGTYKLSFNFDPGGFKIVLLEDLRTKKIQDLKMEAGYRFSALVTDAVNRFVLHFAPVKAQADNDLPAKIYTDGSHILVDLTKIPGDTRVSVYDVLGRKLYEQQLNGESQQTLNFNPGSQLLIVQLQNPKGQLIRKIVYNSIIH